MLIRYFNRIARCTAMFRSESTDLHNRQITYLSLVINNPGISQEQLAKKIIVNKSNVARQLQTLEELGYLERRTSKKDKRVTEVYPTNKAVEVFPLIKSTNATWNRYLLEGFSESEEEQLLAYLERIMKNAVSHLDFPKETE